MVDSFYHIVLRFYGKKRKRDIKERYCGKDVVYDATNIKRKRRIHFLNLLNRIDCIKGCKLIPTTYDECLKNNQKRDRQVPESTIERMYKSFQVPHHNEGFDFVSIAPTYINENYDLKQRMQWLNSFKQDNPHHKYTVGEHCERAAEYVREHDGDKVTEFAALLHDLEKPYCKTFINSKGNRTDIAHYYGHENVSAYCSIGFLKQCLTNMNDILDAAFLINNHMRLMQIDHMNGNKDIAISKLQKQIGEKMMQRLILLYEADKAAS